MGGGMGLFAGGCERVVTESSRLAMPEVSIGLYPDVGASWLLNRLPRGIGEYLGATGAQLNARDALDLGLATRLIPDEQREALKQALCEGEFGRHPSRHLSQVLSEFERRELAPPGQVLPLFDHIQQLVAGHEVLKACQRISMTPRRAVTAMRGCTPTASVCWPAAPAHRIWYFACWHAIATPRWRKPSATS